MGGPAPSCLLISGRIKVDVIREHWAEILRLVASLQAGTVLPSARPHNDPPWFQWTPKGKL